MTLTITTHRRPDAAMVIQPDGPLTGQAASDLRDRVTAVLAAMKPETILVNMDAVPAIDDAGAGALASGHDAAASRAANLVVVDPRPAVYEQLRTRGLGAMVAQAGHRS